MAIDALNETASGTMPGTFNLEQNGLGKEMFLKLLVAQLTNQNPLNPMEDTEFLGQLAQYSSLEQLMNMNDTLNTNNELTISVHNAMMMDLIGKEIKIQSNVLHWSEDATVKISYYHTQGTDVSVQILDETGEVVRNMYVGTKPAGENLVTWDGKDDQGNSVPFGNYLVNVVSKTGDGAEVQLPTFLFGRVTSIQYAGGNPIPYLGNQPVNPSDIVAVYEPSGD